MFPGQGSQHKGMGKELFERFPSETHSANDLLGYDLKELCLNDPNGYLFQTEYTQPSLYFVNCLQFLALQEDEDSLPDYLCGHSLGEYSALFAANVFDLLTGLEIVKKRGEIMSTIKNGSLCAILGQDIENVMDMLKSEGINTLDAANYNTKEQIVIGGLKSDLDQAKYFFEKKGLRCVELNVSGAFHTRYMHPARIEFMRFLMDTTFNTPQIPVISSSTLDFFQPKYALELMGFQIINSINWLQTINKLKSLGVNEYKEVGPGDVLTKMTHKIIHS